MHVDSREFREYDERRPLLERNEWSFVAYNLASGTYRVHLPTRLDGRSVAMRALPKPAAWFDTIDGTDHRALVAYRDPRLLGTEGFESREYSVGFPEKLDDDVVDGRNGLPESDRLHRRNQIQTLG